MALPVISANDLIRLRPEFKEHFDTIIKKNGFKTVGLMADASNTPKGSVDRIRSGSEYVRFSTAMNLIWCAMGKVAPPEADGTVAPYERIKDSELDEIKLRTLEWFEIKRRKAKPKAQKSGVGTNGISVDPSLRDHLKCTIIYVKVISLRDREEPNQKPFYQKFIRRLGETVDVFDESLVTRTLQWKQTPSELHIEGKRLEHIDLLPLYPPRTALHAKRFRGLSSETPNDNANVYVEHIESDPQDLWQGAFSLVNALQRGNEYFSVQLQFDCDRLVIWIDLSSLPFQRRSQWIAGETPKAIHARISEGLIIEKSLQVTEVGEAVYLVDTSGQTAPSFAESDWWVSGDDTLLAKDECRVRLPFDWYAINKANSMANRPLAKVKSDLADKKDSLLKYYLQGIAQDESAEIILDGDDALTDWEAWLQLFTTEYAATAVLSGYDLPEWAAKRLQLIQQFKLDIDSDCSIHRVYLFDDGQQVTHGWRSFILEDVGRELNIEDRKSKDKLRRPKFSGEHVKFIKNSDLPNLGYNRKIVLAASTLDFAVVDKQYCRQLIHSGNKTEVDQIRVVLDAGEIHNYEKIFDVLWRNGKSLSDTAYLYDLFFPEVLSETHQDG